MMIIMANNDKYRNFGQKPVKPVGASCMNSIRNVEEIIVGYKNEWVKV